MRHLWIFLLRFLLIIATLFGQTFDVVAFAQDNSNSLYDEAEAPTIQAADLTSSVDSTKPTFKQANENLALNPGDIPAVPFLPGLSGSGEMNYGPNVLDDIIRQIWRHPFDTQNQPKPDCKKRNIAWRGGGPFKTFAFCCLKGPPLPTGPRAQLDNPRLPYRRRRCFLCTLLSPIFMFRCPIDLSFKSMFAEAPPLRCQGTLPRDARLIPSTVVSVQTM